jgi:peroxiredoxin
MLKIGDKMPSFEVKDHKADTKNAARQILEG